MARITVEDCLKLVPNRFELVMVAAKRARELEMEGEVSPLPREGDKSTVLALREIANGYINTQILENKPADLQPTTTSTHRSAAGESGEAV